MMKQLVAVLISVLLSLGGAFALADAELYYNWDGEFPETPQLEYHAYAVQPNQPDGDALAGAVWPELEWTQTSDANGSLYVLEAEDNSLRGCREFLQVEPGHVRYSRSMTEFPMLSRLAALRRHTSRRMILQAVCCPRMRWLIRCRYIKVATRRAICWTAFMKSPGYRRSSQAYTAQMRWSA